ncbi:MAG: metalloregulator ArsR/SmtB family transcription factor [SAR324 cluster bacterium]|jgi:predicted transcriptional regulator|nr:winged helix-turn-helix transcriptional regulator [SAR324 cluster bacterium]MCH2266802.1 metalloregulator ArsR/SmtB family transcription factor [SAR324 cluster bacterium]
MRCVGPTLSEKELQNLQDQYLFHPEMEECAEFYNLISNPIRLKIIHLLREKKAVCVCDLKDIFGVTAAAVSQHLAKLKAHRIAKSTKQGQTVFYSLTDHPFLSLIPVQKMSQK